MLEDGQKALRVLISGRVQGVFFRDWTVKTAIKNGINGWVRNRSDGSVEALFVGENNGVDLMVKECQIGPTSAKVEKIEITNAIGIVKDGFEQKPTVNLHERRS